MMYTKEILIFLFASTVVVTAPVPAASGLHLTTTILTFLSSFHRVPFSDQSVSARKRSALVVNNGDLQDHDDYLTKDRMIIILTVVGVLLELLLLIFITRSICHACFRLRNQRRLSQPNAERLRAEQVLTGHPRPLDIELSLIHARSLEDQWPLVDDIETPATAPNSPVYYSMMNGNPQADISEVDSLSTNATEMDITDGGVPEIYVTEADAENAFTAKLDEPELQSDSSSTGSRSTDNYSKKFYVMEPRAQQDQYPSFAVLGTQPRKETMTRARDRDRSFLTADVCTPEVNGLESHTTETGESQTCVFETHVAKTDTSDTYAQNKIDVIDWAYYM
ncbi:hypothetical protein HD806DRAFT_552738 [Xylariaceae sp. AK1471]|nr:hypothetical protein HD806DRAFT_552738 [Xylariaceae sp. AK1471]